MGSGVSSLILFVRAFEIFDSLIIEVPDSGRDLFKQVVIVSHEDERAVILLQRDVKGVDGFEVEVVRRLVEHQHVRLLQHELAEEKARRLASGKGFRRLGALIPQEQHLAEQSP